MFTLDFKGWVRELRPDWGAAELIYIFVTVRLARFVHEIVIIFKYLYNNGFGLGLSRDLASQIKGRIFNV